MAYEILEIDNEIIRVRISGVMRLADQKELQKAASDLIDWGLKPRLLIMAENFEGWEKTEGWENIGFLAGYGDFIAKMAIVGDERWKEQIFMFTGKGLRPQKLNFFLLPHCRKPSFGYAHERVVRFHDLASGKETDLLCIGSTND